ncbi:peptide/nickel transport system ATP-binding protein [Antricoccus suffuscus]|uniref:Peptide/nickel transport system ATP-binding protein n=1 Tax=Antricoccus suffuscus TaxID=1629062 RepID=A0A2T1A3G1_9ACTN|nr:ATP-binding cassette domain-containing protein [Antricoccus suffuscus]PRZ43145.1 peptide/nickel transport system ATP-binding protein [Antricoccus suffuscus]
MLVLDDLAVRYPGEPRPVFAGLTLTAHARLTTGVHAPSGSGKTTLLKTAALLLAPEHGNVTLDGSAVNGAGYAVPRDVRRKVGIVFQSPRSSTDGRLTLRQIICAPLSHDRGRLRPRHKDTAELVAQLTEQVQLSDDLLDRLPHQVSDGQLQRACLARALALDPKVLICDEPTAMLDAPTTAVIMRLLRAHADAGAAVLVASHDLPLLDATCDHAASLAELQSGDEVT